MWLKRFRRRRLIYNEIYFHKILYTLFDPATILDEKYPLRGQNIMDFLSFAADVKDNLRFAI
jgi:hypothetical protein